MCLLMQAPQCWTRNATCAGAEPHAYEGKIQEMDNDKDRGVIGLKFIVFNPFGAGSQVLVEKVIDGGPAQEGGIKRGDRIVAVDGISVSALDRDEIVRKIRGEPGTQLVLSIVRGRRRIAVPVIRGGLMNLADKNFKASIIGQDNLDERESRLSRACQSLMMNSAKRTAASLSASVPMENRMKSKQLCDAARFLIERKEYREAAKTLQSAIELDPDFTDLVYVHALVLHKLGKFSQAQQVLQTLVRNNSNWLDAWLALSACLQDEGNTADAIAALKKAVFLTDDPVQEQTLRQRINELMDDSAGT